MRPLAVAPYELARPQRQIGLSGHLGDVATTIGGDILTGLRYVAGGALVAVGASESLMPVHPITGTAQAIATMATGDFSLSHIARNFVNGPSTTFGLGLGLIGNADLHYDKKTGMWLATSSSSGFGRGGTTYGSTFVTDNPNPDERRLHHESIHSWQWASFGGGINFGIAYLTEEIFHPGEENIFERQAGLADGCYTPRPGC